MSSSSKPQIGQQTDWQCACCVGKGSVPMPQVYRETLSMIESAGSPFTLLDLPTGPVPMMNNRLCELERRGYIERTGKRGKFVIWHVVDRSESDQQTSEDENAYEYRHDSEQSGRSGLAFTHS